MNKITKKDNLYNKAKNIVLKENNYSISYLQRTLEIGYNRASALIAALELNGVINMTDKK